METVICVEGCHFDRRVHGTVVYEHSEWKKFVPVVLLVRGVNAEVLFQSLVETLRGSVGLRVECGRKAQIDLGDLRECRPERTIKEATAVRNDIVRETVYWEDMTIKQESKIRGSKSFLPTGNEVSKLCHAIGNNKDRVVVFFCSGEFHEKVKSDGRPGFCGSY